MKFFIFIVIIFFVFISPREIAAQMHHTDAKEQIDGNFTGKLLIEPEKPTSQTQVNLFFTINEKTRNFTIDNCDCTVSIVSNGRLPYTQKITTPSATTNGLYSVIVPFTFPRGGTYDITFHGQPLTTNTFQEFTLQWQLSVPAASEEIQTLKSRQNPSLVTITLISLISIGPVIVGGILLKKKFSKTSHSS